MKWKVPKIWEDGEVWILGGGPSVPEQFDVPRELIDKVLRKEAPPSEYSPYLKPIHSKHVIGVNAAYLLGNWMDIIFFGDNRFYLEHRTRLIDYPGLIVSCSPRISAVPWIKFVEKNREKKYGLSTNPNMVCWNNNSGSSAINIAVLAGAKRIILLGFDMKLDGNGNQHWHKVYQAPVYPGKGHTKAQVDREKLSTFQKHCVGFADIVKEAKELGVEIINASPESTIKEFPKVAVKELLCG